MARLQNRDRSGADAELKLTVVSRRTAPGSASPWHRIPEQVPGSADLTHSLQNSGLHWNFGGKSSRHFIASAYNKQICSEFSRATNLSAGGMANA
jgi:hypothetical protein